MRPKRAASGSIAAQAIAPGADRLDIIIVLTVREFGALELLGDGRQPLEQGRAARNHEAGMAAHHLRRAFGR